MGVFEVFVGLPQVAVGIYLQYSKITVLFSYSFEITQGYAVVASQQRHKFVPVH